MSTRAFRMRALSVAATFGLVLVFTTQPASAAPGDLDPTFGDGGSVLMRDTPVVDVQVQKDGSVVVVDYVGAVRRFTSSG